jgi:hypothetical protein
MAQHWLLNANAVSISLADVCTMSEKEVEKRFTAIRWADNDGHPYCPHCGSLDAYTSSRPNGKDFSVTSGTIFAWHKLPLRIYLLAIVIVCNEVKGKSMLALRRDMVVVALREKGGRSLSRVFKTEADAIPFVRSHVATGSIVHADESPAWNVLHAYYQMKRINHQTAYSVAGACTNDVESLFSRFRRGEYGHHHRVAGPYVVRFMQEASWKEDHRRDTNGEQVDRVIELAMRARPSVDFCGYWQRSM